jgi:DNA-binding response OmpR family regulator
MRILLVEDDEMLADALSRALVQSAHAVDAASTASRPTARWRCASTTW